MRRFATELAAAALALATLAGGAEAAPLSVATLNLYNRPWKRSERVEAAVAVFKEARPDIIALQEVSNGWALPGNTADEIARALGMQVTRTEWHEENLGIFRTGLAVASRHPILSSEYAEFRSLPFWDGKGYQTVRLRLPEGELAFVNLHMASTDDQEMRADEWRQLTAHVRGLSARGPVVLAGDFNTLPRDASMRAFAEATGAVGAFDGRADLDGLRSWAPWPFFGDWGCDSAANAESGLLDHVFAVSGPGRAKPRVLDGKIVARPASEAALPAPSDHCTVTADVRL